MTLDNLLKEVEPILQGSHFTHPSFKEVLVARQLASEINSGKLNVTNAARNLWLYDSYAQVIRRIMDPMSEISHIRDISAPLFRGNLIRAEWKPVLAYLAVMIEKGKAKKFVDAVYDFHKDRIHGIARTDYYAFPQHEVVLEDMALCARFIGRYHTSAFKGREKKIIDTLLSLARKYDDERSSEQDLHKAEIALEALGLTGSRQVANEIIPIFLYSSVGRSSNNEAYKALKRLDFSDDKIENLLLSRLLNKNSLSHTCSHSHTVMWHLGQLGGLKSLETLIMIMADEIPFIREPSNYTDYFLTIFEIIRRHDFNPDLIEMFNDEVSKVQDEKFMSRYHTQLSIFTEHIMRDVHRTDLYERLEKNKMQFWDYWKVYKPK